MIIAQVRAVARDLGVDAVKIGMVGDGAAIEAVRSALDELDPKTPVVLDPVMVAESGGRLLEPGAIEALVTRLFPRATVVTPNLPEARAIAGADGGVFDTRQYASGRERAGFRQQRAHPRDAGHENEEQRERRLEGREASRLIR